MHRWTALLLVLCFGPVPAAEEKPARDRHKVRLGVSVTEVSGGFTRSESGGNFFQTFTETTEAEGASGLGLRAAYEFRPIRRLGIAVSVESFKVDFNFTESLTLETLDFFTGEVRVDRAGGTTDGELRVSPATLGIHVYLSTGRRHELYLGPVAGYVYYGDLEEDRWTGEFEDDTINDLAGPSATFPLENGSGVGGVLGLDLDLGDGNASFHLELGYLEATADAREGDEVFELGIDPVTFRAGAVFRF